MITTVHIHRGPETLPVLKLIGITVAFDAESVLDNVELQLNQRDFVLIVGGNGSGKTTICRLILGELPPTRGQVFVDGKAPSDMRPAARARVLGYVPQNIYDYFIFDTLKAEIDHALAIRTHDRSEYGHRQFLADAHELGISVQPNAKPLDLEFFDAWRLSCLIAATAAPSILIIDEAPGIDRPEVAKTLDMCYTSVSAYGGVLIGTGHKFPRWISKD